jgi:DNA-binding XRE family transcriptional regulator
MNELVMWRLQMGWTQAQLAKKLGIGASTVHSWETETTKPPPYIWLAFAQLKTLQGQTRRAWKDAAEACEP